MAIDGFLRDVAAAAPDALVLCGDIGQAMSVTELLSRLEQGIACPIYFVLGNHDFYRGSIAGVRAAVAEHARAAARSRWLRDAGVISLTPHTALIGVDGWSDGRFGDYHGSPVMLNDYIMIKEISGLSAAERLRRLQQIADDEARILDTNLRAALASHRRVIAGIHVPPFAAAASSGPSGGGRGPRARSTAGRSRTTTGRQR